MAAKPGRRRVAARRVALRPDGRHNKFVYDTSAETGKPLTTHQCYDGTQHPWEFKRVWHIEPSLTDPDVVYAGVEDAAIFRDRRRDYLAGNGGTARTRHRSQVAAGRGRHVPAHHLLDPSDPQADVHRDFCRGRVSHR